MRMLILIACLLIFSYKVYSEELNYNFYWSIIPVSQLSMDLGNSLRKNRKEVISSPKFSIETRGPLKIFRNYKSSGYLELKDDGNWLYNLIGTDRGQPEEKVISYSSSSYPIVKVFIDDKGIDSIKVDAKKDNGAMDPFTAMLMIMKKIETQDNCDIELPIFDGKRRYMLKAEQNEIIAISSINKDYYEGSALGCKISLLGRFIEDHEYKNKWPFNGEERSFNIWFANKAPNYPVRFEIKTPIGTIIGKLLILNK